MAPRFIIRPESVSQGRFPKHMADDAYAAHAALVRAEKADPSLIGNPHWKALRDSAYARFRSALEAV